MLNGVFQENLQLLGRFQPKKAEALAKIPLDYKPTGLEVKSGWVEGLELGDVTTIVVYGISALGEEYHALRRWLQQNPTRTALFLVDDFLRVRALVETSIATELLKNPQAILWLFDWPEQNGWAAFSRELDWFFKGYSTGKILFTVKSAPTVELLERIPRLEWVFKRNVDDRLRLYHSYLVAQKEAFDSYYPNLLELLNAKCGQAMTGAFKGVPALICGAGPSLEQHFDQLRSLTDKALIFGAGSAVNVLSRHGILPHFGGTVDPTSTQLSRLSTNDAFFVPYFYLNRFNNEALRFLQGEKLCLRGGVRLYAIDWFDEQLGLTRWPRVPSGMSSSNFCFEVALLLGCNPIILVGIDLCYKEGGVRYASGVTAHPAEDQKHHQEIGRIKPNILKGKGVGGEEVTTSWDWMVESECFSASRAEHPDIGVWNATEGGMPLEGIANISLKEAVDNHLRDARELDPLIHRAIQQSGLELITKDLLQEMFERWRDSLIYCKQALEEQKRLLDDELDRRRKDPVEKTREYLSVDLQKLLGDTPAYTHCLKQFNEIFDCLNHKDFFRMSHYPDVYPAWKQRDMMAVIEVGRCSFLLEKIDYHLAKTLQVLKDLPTYPMIPRSSSELCPGPLVEKQQSVEAGVQVCHYFYATGELYAIKRYKDGRLDGLQEYFFVDGMPRLLMGYHRGLLDGEVRLYYPTGMHKRSLHFSCGQRNGVERLWSEKGVLIREVCYAAGKPIGNARQWDPAGVLISDTVFTD